MTTSYNILQPGQIVHAEDSGLECRVDRYIGGGGQGEVYRAYLGDQSVALKWYPTRSATPEQRAALEVLVRKGTPNARFLWPIELASEPGVKGYGYIMALREERYVGIGDLMMRKVNPSIRSVITIALQLAETFLQLHARGFCYRDISFGNVFFDPQDGSVLICDNDNVTVDGSKVGGVMGTQRFMAPEVVRNEAAPSTRTDQFSLAVLLFYLLMSHHPLEGEKEAAIHSMDSASMNQLYGLNPIFIFDPENTSNRPIVGLHDNALKCWPIYPAFLRNLFTQVFTVGIRDPDARVKVGEWRRAFARLRDSIVYCTACRSENFYDADALNARGGSLAPCWSCNRPIQVPARIRIGTNVIILNHDTKLFPHHVDENRMYDFSAPIATMVQHPSKPALWGIKNLSGDNWVAMTVGGETSDVPPGRSVTMAIGTKIQFGKVEGEVRL